jgi:hypothetical protein
MARHGVPPLRGVGTHTPHSLRGPSPIEVPREAMSGTASGTLSTRVGIPPKLLYSLQTHRARELGISDKMSAVTARARADEKRLLRHREVVHRLKVRTAREPMPPPRTEVCPRAAAPIESRGLSARRHTKRAGGGAWVGVILGMNRGGMRREWSIGQEREHKALQ